MDDFDLVCMKKSVLITEKQKSEKLRVGVVIRLDNGLVLCSKSSGKTKSAWTDEILKKLFVLKAWHVSAIYLTINTFSKHEFDLNRLFKKISVDKIFIGLPDPEICEYLFDDPVIRLKNVRRYPDYLQKILLEQNSTIFAKSRQNIKFSPYYSDVRISKIVQGILAEKGIVLSNNELGRNKNVDKLINYLVGTKAVNLKIASDIVNGALSQAFNEKYGAYDYKKDARFLSLGWDDNFKKILDNYFPKGIKKLSVLNVGVGSGEEASRLFDSCQNISFVDIASGGLKKIKKQMPWSKIFKTRAEVLKGLNESFFDVYISLRTYNSSFFDISKALDQAYRVLKNRGVLIISVANGFLCSNSKILPGLIIPGCEFVDIYRGLEVIGNIREECEKLGFNYLQIYPTATEIYLAGICNKKEKKTKIKGGDNAK